MRNRIKELRLERGLTLEQVAVLANTSNQQVQRLETGRRRLTTEWMQRIARALEVDPRDLLPLPAGGAALAAEEAVLVAKFRRLPREARRAVRAVIDSYLPDEHEGGNPLRKATSSPSSRTG